MGVDSPLASSRMARQDLPSEIGEANERTGVYQSVNLPFEPLLGGGILLSIAGWVVELSEYRMGPICSTQH